MERRVRMERRREGEEKGLGMGCSWPIAFSEGCFSWLGRGGGEAFGEKWLTMGFVMGARAAGFIVL